ncbi:MAG: NADH-quinone oxidoreductase subunit K [Syntrophorhabdaceae bacterium PtaU1.Bin034]|jgi:NADH-quinone oxidoreductase subunit K|nr:MAG: NADH-quinone oxidoreductase subunit K [Syntrophorhabdaceae bacterium PtaU1.Bin034]
MLHEIPLNYYFALSAALFTIGAIGVITRRNAIIVFMCIELMLNGVNMAFITAGNMLNSVDGMIFVFFVMTVAAAEAAIGLAIFVLIFRLKGTINVDEINLLKG